MVVISWLLPAAAGVALVWKGQQLLRDPSNVALRVVVLNIALAETGNLLVALGPESWLPDGVAMLVQNVFLVFGTYLLVAFFLFASRADARPLAMAQLAVAVAVAAAMVVAWAEFTPGQRAGEASPVPGVATPAAVAVFYLLALGYFGYTNIVCIRLALRAARRADVQPAIGLRLAATGLAGAFVFLVLYRASLVLLGYAGLEDPVPAGLAVDAGLLSLLVFLLGLCWPGLVTRGRAAGRLARLWRRSRRLRPLRRLLGPAVEDGGSPSATTTWRRLPGRWRMRATDRWAECRDGLVAASAYVPAEHPAPHDLDSQATVLRLALGRRERGSAPVTPRALFAVPAAETFDADLDSLVELSLAVARRPAR